VAQSVKGRLVEASPNCRICGLDTSAGVSWKDANGYQYCHSCLSDLRRQPPYQSPLFECNSCGQAWPLKALSEQDDALICKDCLASPPVAPPIFAGATVPTAGSNGGPVAAKHPAEKRPPARPVEKEITRFNLGPPPGNILPRMTCPHCWHVFPTDDVLFVSQHGELLGDPVLGPEAQLRFRPSRFNAEGEALDARDTSCQLLACPRCHLSVARAMTQTAPLFVSIIGAPASGKSHFLASMTWELRRVLSDKFGISFNDADASTNHSLNEYEQTLFLQDDMDRLVSIRKTELQGELYDQIRLGEQVISLPKPFLFTLRPSPKAPPGPMRMVCLYDNAGEHFQPGMDTVSLPGTQHMAKARVLWFMYDPTQHPRFREQCRSLSQDPQIYGSARTIRQEVLLTEAATRIRRYTGLSAQTQYDRPLVVIVSKADIWGQLLGANLGREPLVNSPDADGLWAVDIERVEKISAALRKLLLMLSPEFVTAAEDFCRHVVYLPVSALGRGPEVQAETGMLAIRPRDIRPQWATVPFLYMFAKWSSGLVSGVRWSPETPIANSDAKTVIISQAVKAPRPEVTPTDTAAHCELVYTSAPRGLRPGSSGFCTVAMTGGMPAALVDRLESLSSYQPIFPPGSESAAKNPIIHAHWRVAAAGRARSVLSRIELAGLDYTQRPNKLAYYVVVDPAKQPPAGPAWTMLQPGVMLQNWSGEPQLIQRPKALPMTDIRPARCTAWQAATGDAGWAGVLAEAFLLDPSRVSYLIYEAGFDPLLLLSEAIALLPAPMRWYVTFNTYFTELPAGLVCAWRCVVADTSAAMDARRYATSGVVIDLTTRPGPAPENGATQSAREGTPLVLPAPADPPPQSSTKPPSVVSIKTATATAARSETAEAKMRK
jgi:hypothetical protein